MTDECPPFRSLTQQGSDTGVLITRLARTSQLKPNTATAASVMTMFPKALLNHKLMSCLHAYILLFHPLCALPHGAVTNDYFSNRRTNY